MTEETHTKRTRRRGCLVVGVLVFLCAIGALVWLYREVVEGMKSEDIVVKPKTLGFWMEMYAKGHDGFFPPLDSEPGCLMFTKDSLYPDNDMIPWALVSDVDKKSCAIFDKLVEGDLEGNRKYIDDHSFIYLGYAMTSEEEGLAFIDAYRAQIEKGLGFEEDLPVEPGRGTAGTDTLFRLRTDIERVLFEKHAPAKERTAPMRIPVLLERPGHHRHNTGGWVLFLDGHCEMIPYPGPFPMTARFIEGLQSLELLALQGLP